jgi:hypothetical protein
MRFLLPAALAVAVLAGSWPVMALSYECKADLVVGYRFDENRSWSATQFRPSDSYTIRSLNDEELKASSYPQGTLFVFKAKYKHWIYACIETNHSNTTIGCPSLTVFAFDTQSLRYQTYYVGGYVSGRDDNYDTPSVEIGRCYYGE